MALLSEGVEQLCRVCLEVVMYYCVILFNVQLPTQPQSNTKSLSEKCHIVVLCDYNTYPTYLLPIRVWQYTKVGILYRFNVPNILVGGLNRFDNFMSITSLTDSLKNNIFEQIITPWTQDSLYLKKLHTHGRNEIMNAYHPPLAFFLFPVWWHWL